MMVKSSVTAVEHGFCWLRYTPYSYSSLLLKCSLLHGSPSLTQSEMIYHEKLECESARVVN